MNNYEKQQIASNLAKAREIQLSIEHLALSMQYLAPLEIKINNLVEALERVKEQC